ncbi:NADH:ubiquinone oxidoreductase subunit 3 (chain A) [Bernardetia litoralis DSM 6794]|uniref:NADH-quinone oxidoreductase subunit n=1 Tax=Bernardetia litoralis (strain ATCC 23117 / DSM 6794 / NBRC 15988 / NCIMB 1366 / Fx l1 / Sio-4) TaxID=880071 RepID=I4AJP5_BERLS|nr:NADH-quinone oxidoreductase subunit A [Bernardetia litoralis]AFM04180.1 NADH:ubiquinone oxidoreductase subunit 3 (chain A) [Bernardetia litoralis DSM 6794]
MLCSVSTFGLVLLFLIIGAFFALISLNIGKIFRPDNPTKEKLSTYECGEETVIGNWGKFNIRFYLIALVFVLFEVEIIFLFPWSKILTDAKLQALESNWKIYAFTEGLLFIGILVLGLAYLWKSNLLDWQFDFSKKDKQQVNLSENFTVVQQGTNEKLNTKKENNETIPSSLYQQINTRYT